MEMAVLNVSLVMEEEIQTLVLNGPSSAMHSHIAPLLSLGRY
jgi:hypothetical protein